MKAFPKLAVGTMNFGKRTDAAESDRIVKRALERGVTWFDTANVYVDGTSEKILGKALSKDRDRAIVATKVGFLRVDGKPEGLRPERVLRAIDESLERLAMPFVDLYYLHVPDRATPIEETLSAMHEIVRAGKAKAWGVSNFASWQILEMNQICEARGMPKPAVAQQMYNPMIRQLDVEYFAFAKKHPIHTTIYNPLAGGLLAGKHSRGEPPKGSRFDGNALYKKRYWTDRMFDFVDALADIAKDEGVSLVDLAYAWVSARNGVDSVILGPGTVAHLDAGIDGCAKSLSEGARAKVDDLYRAFQGTDATYAR
jgi:aryl-alcohol dehydrogenase-like predicted oxidoreductase